MNRSAFDLLILHHKRRLEVYERVAFGPDEPDEGVYIGKLPRYPGHELANTGNPNKAAKLVRGLAENGDRDKLAFNADGSLDLYVARESPGPEKESNWLPAPAGGPFTMNMRLYWPKAEVIYGLWSPPPVKRAD